MLAAKSDDTVKHEYCDLSLPVPLDQTFTYRMPETLRHRVQRGCRVSAPFGARKLTGVVLRVHDEAPKMTAREVFNLLDEELGRLGHEELLSLGKWISAYYCAPLGESLAFHDAADGRSKAGEAMFLLTDTGRDAARQLLLGAGNEDPAIELLRLLEARPMAESYLKSKFDNAKRLLQSLEKKGFLDIEDVEADRDPLRAMPRSVCDWNWSVSPKASSPRASANCWRTSRAASGFAQSGGSRQDGQGRKRISPRVGSKADRDAVAGTSACESRSHRTAEDTQHPSGRGRFRQDRCGIAFRKQYQAFLLQGVTGSGKTEVYLRSIEAALAYGKSALLLVPEIALTPAVAGQFFGRFGETVAILHSAFNDAERAEQWRRIRAGKSEGRRRHAFRRLRAGSRISA